MKTVEVTNGYIWHGEDRYAPGQCFIVSDEQADSFVRLKVAKVVPDEKQEDQPVDVVPEFKEMTDFPAGPVMHVDDIPFVVPPKKRGRRKRG